MMKQTLESDLQHRHSPVLGQEYLKISAPEEQPSNGDPPLSTQRLENDRLEPLAVIGFTARLSQETTSVETF